MDPGTVSPEQPNKPPVDPSQMQPVRGKRQQPLEAKKGSAPIADVPADVLALIVQFLSADELTAVREVSSWFSDHIAKPAKSSDPSQVNPARFKAAQISKRVLQSAALKGAIPFLEWAAAHQVPIHEGVCNEAVQAGKLDVLKWAANKGYPINMEECASLAIQHGHIPILQWLHEDQSYQFGYQKMNHAASNGQLEVMQWLESRGVDIDIGNNLDLAAAKGFINIMEWLHEKGYRLEESNCCVAAWNGQLEALKWLRAHGCPWDERTCLYAKSDALFEWAMTNGAPYNREGLLQSAAEGSSKWIWLEKNTFTCNAEKEDLQFSKQELEQTEIAHLEKSLSSKDLKLLMDPLPSKVEEQLPPRTDRQFIPSLMTALARYGSVKTLQSMMDHQFPPPKTKFCEEAAAGGNLEALKWGRAQNYPWGHTAYAAAKMGRLDLLKWAIAQGCPWDERACYAAAEQGHFNLLLWALAHGAPYDAEKLIKSTANYPTMRASLAVKAAELGLIPLLDKMAEQHQFQPSEKFCEAAASGGQLEALKWARSHGCPWGMTLENASEGAHWDLVKWAHEIGRPFSGGDSYLYSIAVQQGRLDIVNWLYEQDCPNGENVVILATAASKGDMFMLQWLHEHSFPSGAWVCASAAEGGHLKVLQWLRDKGYAWSANTIAGAAKGGHLDILQWARKEGCPWKENAFLFAAMYGQTKFLEWLKKEDAPYDLNRMLASSNITPANKTWLRQNLK